MSESISSISPDVGKEELKLELGIDLNSLLGESPATILREIAERRTPLNLLNERGIAAPLSRFEVVKAKALEAGFKEEHIGLSIAPSAGFELGKVLQETTPTDFHSLDVPHSMLRKPYREKLQRLYEQGELTPIRLAEEVAYSTLLSYLSFSSWKRNISRGIKTGVQHASSANVPSAFIVRTDSGMWASEDQGRTGEFLMETVSSIPDAAQNTVFAVEIDPERHSISTYLSLFARLREENPGFNFAMSFDPAHIVESAQRHGDSEDATYESRFANQTFDTVLKDPKLFGVLISLELNQLGRADEPHALPHQGAIDFPSMFDKWGREIEVQGGNQLNINPSAILETKPTDYSFLVTDSEFVGFMRNVRTSFEGTQT